MPATQVPVADEADEAGDLVVETTPLVASLKEGKGLAKQDANSGSLSSLTGLNTLSKHYGHRLLVMLFASQHLMKGFGVSFTGPAQKFLYQAYAVSGPQMQIFEGVTQLPWAMKPIIGLVSDLVPVMGLNKMPYMLMACLLGLSACAAVGIVPQEQLSLTQLVGGLFLMSFMFSTCDLLTEAKYAEKMRASPEHGPALMTYVWFGINLGALVAVACVGWVIETWSAKLPFALAVLPLSFILVPMLRNDLEEEVKSPEEVQESRQKILAQKEACVLCVLMFCGTILLAVLGIFYESAAVNAVASLSVALVMLISFSLVLRPVIAKVNALSLIQTSLSFSIGGASFYFFTDEARAYPEGPHFSKEFYTSVLGVVSILFSLLGIYTYNRFATGWSYQRLFITTNVALSVLSIADVIVFARLNVVLGIPDHWWVLGSGIFASVIDQWMWMPGVVLLSQLCPEGVEATMYALLAGCHNLGNTISSNCGALVLEWLGCKPNGMDGESAQFKNLWLASLLSTLLPLFTIALIPYLIPDAKQTEKLLPDGDQDATKGSLLRRWQGRD